MFSRFRFSFKWLRPVLLTAFLPLSLGGCEQNDPAVAPEKRMQDGKPQPAVESEGTEARIEMIQGAPALVVNGKPVPFLSHNFAEARYMDSRWNETVRNFAQDGVPIVVDWEYFAETWKGPDKFDFSYDDAKWERIHRLAPDALIMPWIVLGTPLWWDEEHADQLNVWEDGTKGNLRPGRAKGSASRNPTVGSNQWIEDVEKALRTYIRHQRSQPWGKQIVGYTIGLGPDGGGAYMWYEPKEDLYMADYSPLVAELFRNWLREHYNGDVEKLREAWNDPKVDFETAMMPTPERRSQGTLFDLHDPQLSGAALDAARFNGDRLFDFLNRVVSIIKEETEDKAIVGMGLAGGATLSSYPGTNTHGRERTDYRMVTESNVDFVESILSYFNREAGTGDSNYDSAIDSIALHGKMHDIQDDTRTWQTILQYAGSQNAERAVNWQKIRSQRDSDELLKRNIVPALMRNQAMYWLPHGVGWYESPGSREARTTLARLIGAKIPRGAPAPAEVALIVDPESTFYESSDFPVSLRALRHAMDRVLGRTGAPWDVFYLDDLDDPRVADYKVYLIANAHHLSAGQREILKAKIRKNNAVTVFSFADGLIDDDSLDPELMSDVSGIGMALLRAKGNLAVVTDNAKNPILADVSPGTTWGVEPEVGPLPFVDDSTAVILGQYPKGTAAGGKPAFAVKKFEDHTSIYTAAPTPPAEVLRNIYRMAGVHLYLESGDVLHAKGDFVMVHTSRPTRQTVRLPAEVEVVYDIFSGTELAKNSSEFVSDLDGNTTGLYFAGSAERLKQVLAALEVPLPNMPEFQPPPDAAAWVAGGRQDGIRLIGTHEISEAGERVSVRTSPEAGRTSLEFVIDPKVAGSGDVWLELEYYTDRARDALGETAFAGLMIDYAKGPDGKLVPHPVFGHLYSGTQGKMNFMPFGNTPAWRKYYLLLRDSDFSKSPGLRIRTLGNAPLHIHSVRMWQGEPVPPITAEWGF